MGDMGDRLKQARARNFKSARQAAIRFGWAPSTYAAHENGQNDYGPEEAKRYAKAFKTRASWLLTGEGSPARLVNIVGDIGAGEQIYAFDDEAMGGGEPIDAPPGIGENAIAVRVSGESMQPEYDDGDVIVYDRIYHSDFDLFLKKRVVIGLPDGRRYVKRLFRGSSAGLYTLRSSNPREPDIEDVVVDWIAPIAWIKPALIES